MPSHQQKDTKMDVKIIDATLADIDFLMELEKGSIIHPWDRDSLKNLVLDDNKIALVAVNETNEKLGYIGCSFVLDEVEIGNLVVSSKCRRMGIGNLIINELKTRLKNSGIETVFLEVESTNEPAIKLYEKAGFKPYNKRTNYYGNGRDCILMNIHL